MARQRKAKGPQTIPLISPSAAAARPGPAKPLLEIPEDEQWRLINQSGILNSASIETMTSVEAAATQDSTEVPSLSDDIFNAVLLIIPFSSILLLMEILIRQQYGKTASMEAIMDRMVPGVPILSIFIFYTVRYKQHRRIQTLLFTISVLVGSRMLYLIDNASWLVNMKQCPALATIWIYTIVQLDLELAVVSLLTVGAFVWWKDLKILR
ncbi:hypothetical protein BDZ97DRAFT_1751072 [Flammula alnicola]|nr:hypothetical protein BDZ97DRAFT_1751072 [Flammula alnicola]